MANIWCTDQGGTIVCNKDSMNFSILCSKHSIHREVLKIYVYTPSLKSKKIMFSELLSKLMAPLSFPIIQLRHLFFPSLVCWPPLPLQCVQCFLARFSLFTFSISGWTSVHIKLSSLNNLDVISMYKNWDYSSLPNFVLSPHHSIWHLVVPTSQCCTISHSDSQIPHHYSIPVTKVTTCHFPKIKSYSFHTFH